jgi:hypothetical protein
MTSLALVCFSIVVLTFCVSMYLLLCEQVRLCLLLLSVCYLPVVAAVVRALLPVFDWDDASAAPSRKQHNYHVPCYYTGFPPRVTNAPCIPHPHTVQ